MQLTCNMPVTPLCRRGGVKKSASSITKKLKSGASGHPKVSWSWGNTANHIIIGYTLIQSSEVSVVFKSYDKSSGVSLRSSKVGSFHSFFSHYSVENLQMKIPMTLGQKKAKTIEQLLEELGLS